MFLLLGNFEMISKGNFNIERKSRCSINLLKNFNFQMKITVNVLNFNLNTIKLVTIIDYIDYFMKSARKKNDNEPTLLNARDN